MSAPPILGTPAQCLRTCADYLDRVEHTSSERRVNAYILMRAVHTTLGGIHRLVGHFIERAEAEDPAVAAFKLREQLSRGPS